MAEASSSTPVPTKKRSRSDFSFAFENPRFPDCVLRVHVDAANPDSTGSVVEVPVSTLVLASNSLVFEKMFSGDFREGSQEKGADIHVESKECFMDLLHFMYNGVLPEDSAGCFDRALELVEMADKFEVWECFHACISTVSALIPLSPLEYSLRILDIPAILQWNESLVPIVVSAHDALVKFGSEVLTSQSGSEGAASKAAKVEFLKLPESAVLKLLRMKHLKFDREDVVANAAAAWVLHNFDDPQAALERFFSVIFPVLCLQKLSPPALDGIMKLYRQSLPLDEQKEKSSAAPETVVNLPGKADSLKSSTEMPSRGDPSKNYFESFTSTENENVSKELNCHHTTCMSFVLGQPNILAELKTKFRGRTLSNEATVTAFDALSPALIDLSACHYITFGSKPPTWAMISWMLHRFQCFPRRLIPSVPECIRLDVDMMDSSNAFQGKVSSAPACVWKRWIFIEAHYVRQTSQPNHVTVRVRRRRKRLDIPEPNTGLNLFLLVRTQRSNPLYEFKGKAHLADCQDKAVFPKLDKELPDLMINDCLHIQVDIHEAKG